VGANEYKPPFHKTEAGGKIDGVWWKKQEKTNLPVGD
jgi:hypothetical protein